MGRTRSNRDVSESLTVFRAAADDWHGRCYRLCLHHARCPDRYFAVVEALLTWMAEHPAQARVYWGDGGSHPQPELLCHAVAARQHLTSIMMENAAGNPLSSRHLVQIEFVMGLVRQIVDAELRRGHLDHTRLESKLIRLAPLLTSGGPASCS